MKQVQYNEYIISTEYSTDGLVLKHQAIRGYNFEYASMRFELFLG